VKETITLH